MTEPHDESAGRFAEVRQTAEEKLKAARERAAAAGERARVRATETSAAARDKALNASRKAKSGLEQNPLAAIAGGLALGAIAAALLPATERENRLAGNVGRKVRAKAGEAARAARNTAKAQLDELGLNADTARDSVRDIVKKVGKAAASAGNAAADSVRK